MKLTKEVIKNVVLWNEKKMKAYKEVVQSPLATSATS